MILYYKNDIELQAVPESFVIGVPSLERLVQDETAASRGERHEPGMLSKVVWVSAAAFLPLIFAPAEPPPGDYTFKFKHDGRERQLHHHVPKDTLTNPWPVVLNSMAEAAVRRPGLFAHDETSDREDSRGLIRTAPLPPPWKLRTTGQGLVSVSFGTCMM